MPVLKVLGPVYIGDNVRVGAGSVVLKNLPANTTAVGVPAEVVRVRGSQSCPADDLDQQALPDVLSNRISALEARLSRMEAAMQGQYHPTNRVLPPRKRTVYRRRICIQKNNSG